MRNWECEISQLGNTNIYEVFLLKIYENYIYKYEVLLKKRMLNKI